MQIKVSDDLFCQHTTIHRFALYSLLTDKWVPDQVKVSKASCLCGSLMLLLVPLMSVLTLF